MPWLISFSSDVERCSRITSDALPRVRFRERSDGRQAELAISRCAVSDHPDCLRPPTSSCVTHRLPLPLLRHRVCAPHAYRSVRSARHGVVHCHDRPLAGVFLLALDDAMTTSNRAMQRTGNRPYARFESMRTSLLARAVADLVPR
jgi:hypothetical protein